MNVRSSLALFSGVVLALAVVPSAPAGATPLGSGVDDVIAYGGTGIVYEYDPATGVTRRLSAPDVTPSQRDGQLSYSPDGARVTYTHQVGKYRQIFVADRDGSDAKQLTVLPDDADVDHQSPNFSPDGRTIAFLSGGMASISTIGADGSNRTQYGATSSDFAVYHPDGTKLLFTKYAGGQQIFTLSLADGSVTQLTEDGPTVHMMANWSPDGSRIVYVQREHNDCKGGCIDRVWVMNADGTDAHVLHPDGTYDLWPQFSPDGKHIVFDSYGENAGLYEMNADGSGAGRLPLNEAVGIGNHEMGVAAWRARPLGEDPAPPADGSLAASVLGGGVFATGTEATPAGPIQSRISVPDGVSGTLTVQPQPTDATAPSGYSLFGRSVVLDGPALDPGSPSPYTVTFTVDASVLGDTAAADVQMFRNGEPLPDCADGPAAGTPCVVSRASTADGDAVITVRTWHFSTWTPGVKLLTPVNRPPTADNVVVSTAKSTKVAVGLVGADPEGAKLTYATGAPLHGSLTGTAPALTYTPASGYVGSDSFTYTVSDGALSSATATVTISIAQANRPPVAHSGLVVTRSGRATDVTLRGTDADGDALTYARGTAAHGTLTGSGRSLTYTPAAGFSGVDAFTYTVNDGKVTSAKGTIVVIVVPNRRPVATGQKVTVQAGKTASITLSASDPEGDPVTYAWSRPAHGTVSGSGSKVVYTPTRGYSGPDSFTFTASDGLATSAPATVSISVRPA